MYTNKIIIKNFGMQDWKYIFQKMHNFISNRNFKSLDEIWFLEHESVFTQGKSENSSKIEYIHNIPVVYTDRGGKITYHGPGQQIIYLLLDLKRGKIYPRKLIFLIEKIILETLELFSIKGSIKKKYPGVYVNNKKICSIGLKIKNGFSLYGLSLNIDMNLLPFSYIIPCGLKNVKMTQMKNYHSNVSFNTVQLILIKKFKFFNQN